MDEIYDFKTQAVIWGDSTYARSNLDKWKGIMFKSRKEFDFPMVFDFGKKARFANSIHSLFCVPFDAIFLDEKKRVVEILLNVRPWQLFIMPRVAFRYLIEAPPGETETVGIKVGQKLEFNYGEL